MVEVEWYDCLEIPIPEDEEYLIWDGSSMSIGEYVYANKNGSPVCLAGAGTFHPTHWANKPKPPAERKIGL